MPDYPYSDNMYSALEDSDVEEQPPLEYPDQAGSGPVEDGDRRTPVHGHESGYGIGAARHDAYHQDQQDEEEIVLSPTDGYFGRSESRPSSTSRSNSALQGDPYSPSSQDQEGQTHAASASASPPASGYAAATSSQVPHVPDVWVPDPSLEQGSTAESKAREAREERELNARRQAGQLDHNPLALSTSAHRRVGGFSASSSDVNPHSTISTSSYGSGAPRYGYGPGLSSVAPYNQRYPPPSSSAALSRPQRSGTIYSERSSLFSEAPPAYTPSPTSPTTAASSSNYQTFPPPSSSNNNMGRISESETRGLLAGHHQYSGPQDMGGEPEDDAYTFARIGDWRDRVRSRAPHFTGRTCKLFVLGLVLLFVTVGFLVSSFVSVKDERQSHKPGGGGSGDSPSDKMPNKDNDKARLSYPPFDSDLRWAEGHVCAAKKIIYPTQIFYYEISAARSLSLVQEIKKDHGHNGQEVRVSGDVVVRRAGEGTPGPSITLEIISTNEAIEVDIDWDEDEQQLYVRTPRSLSSWASSSGAELCLQIRATIWMLPDSILESLNIETVHLGVDLLDNLSLQITEAVRIASTVGAVVAATDGDKDPKQLMHEAAPSTFSLDSRRIEVKTTSNYIAGTWPLYDYLGLETVSGAVRAGVQPKDALQEKPKPAVLYVHTTSGTIEVYEPIAEAAAAAAAAAALAVRPRAAGDIIPPRQYEVDLHTMSGWIRGSVAFSSLCQVHTTAGDINLSLLPVLDKSQISSASSSSAGDGSSVLETATTSGTTVISVLDALWRDIQTGSSFYSYSPSSASSSSPAIRVLDSRHSTTSSPIRVTYPAAWEGTIEADSLTGRLDVSGRGVEIIRRDEEFPGYKKHVLARKGRDGVGGELKCLTTSGSITVEVGS